MQWKINMSWYHIIFVSYIYIDIYLYIYIYYICRNNFIYIICMLHHVYISPTLSLQTKPHETKKANKHKTNNFKLLEYRIVGFAVGPPNFDIRNVNLRTGTSRNTCWNSGKYSMVDDRGCSRSHMQPFAAAIKTRISALAHIQLPASTDALSRLPSGFVRVRFVDPIDLKYMWELPLNECFQSGRRYFYTFK